MKLRFYQILFVFMLAALMSCKHETFVEPGPCDDGYELKYFFIRNGDNNVKHVIITTSSYNARVDSSWQFVQGYADSIAFPDAFAFITEPLEQAYNPYSTANCFTPGSTKWMKIDIRLSHPDSAMDVLHRMEFILSDTNWVKMYEPEDFTETFIWPQDTNRYIKITDYWIN